MDRKYLSRFKFDKNARRWTWITYNVRRLTRATAERTKVGESHRQRTKVNDLPRMWVTEAPSTRSYILRLDLQSTLIRHDNGDFRKRLSHDNHVIFVKHKSKMTGDCDVFKLIRSVLAGNIWCVFSVKPPFLNFYGRPGEIFNSTQCLLSFGPSLTTVTLRSE